MCSSLEKGEMMRLITYLNSACKAYYSGTDEPTISDVQYDKALSELINLEEKAGLRLPDSPTVRVGFKEPNEDGRVQHYAPILSLKDTKNVDEMLAFLGDQEGVLSWKLDGVSIVLHYAYGVLQQALSRGDGHLGKDITKNVIQMRSVPKHISIKNNVIIRGEGCISLNEFEQIKNTREGECFSNPRNLASGIINSTRSTSPLLQHVTFIAHSAILLGGKARNIKAKHEQLLYMRYLGFKVVAHSRIFDFKLKDEIEKYTREIPNYEYPVDGLVLSLNNLEYGKTLGSTAKYPRDSIAFKWPDVSKLTTVTGMKWSVSKTGLITPVVQFDPIELEGTNVSQANLHSLKIFQSFGIGVGDTLRVYKANKIIPEVEENLTRSETEEYPRICPVCGSKTTVVETEMTKKLYCINCGGNNNV